MQQVKVQWIGAYIYYNTLWFRKLRPQKNTGEVGRSCSAKEWAFLLRTIELSYRRRDISERNWKWESELIPVDFMSLSAAYFND